jgi:hypothetical protein
MLLLVDGMTIGPRLGGCLRDFVRPTEHGTINPNAMHDDSQSAGQRNNRLL